VTGWTALDRRTVAVTALVMVGVSITAGTPIGIGIARNTSIGTALLWLLPAAALLVAGGSAVDHIRWRRTRAAADRP
jgi:putative membrane protein